MKKRANELVFISRIHADGTGVTDVSGHEIFGYAGFTLTPLSLTNGTYIAHGPINTYVVKLQA